MLEPASCKQWIMRGGQPQMRKHRQAPISPKFPKSQQLRPAHLIDGILGKFEPGDVLALPAYTNQILGKFEPGDALNTAGLEFPKIPETLNAQVIEEQPYHVLIHQPSIPSVPNYALASSIEQSHICC